MATDMNRLQGEISVDPEVHEMDVEALLVGFLNALLSESGARPASRNTTTREEMK